MSDKRCTCCCEIKPAAAFLPSRWMPDGLTDSCKTCIFARARTDQAERDRRQSAALGAPGPMRARSIRTGAHKSVQQRK
jgi:hypothetical protein